MCQVEHVAQGPPTWAAHQHHPPSFGKVVPCPCQTTVVKWGWGANWAWRPVKAPCCSEQPRLGTTATALFPPPELPKVHDIYSQVIRDKIRLREGQASDLSQTTQLGKGRPRFEAQQAPLLSSTLSHQTCHSPCGQV